MAGDPFCKVVRRPENTYGGADRFAWRTSGSPPSFEWPANLSFSPKLQTSYCLSSPTRKYEHASSPTYFLFMAGYWNLHTSGVFFPVICWSYLRTEISVTLSTGNKLHSRHPPFLFSLSCETTLLMLSCDRIESAKFIHSTLSPAKLVYYTRSCKNKFIPRNFVKANFLQKQRYQDFIISSATNIIRYNLWPTSTASKLCNQKYERVIVQNDV